MKTTTQTVCGRCSGTGTYRGAGWTGSCYGCDGSGVAHVAPATVRAIESANAYSAAVKALRNGIAGAREFFAANRTSPVAVDALYYALLDADMTREAQALHAFCARRAA